MTCDVSCWPPSVDFPYKNCSEVRKEEHRFAPIHTFPVKATKIVYWKTVLGFVYVLDCLPAVALCCSMHA